ncbi:MAG: NAD(P)/FAD-dependent oxidoreductase [Bacteroidota bacterium]
MIDVVIVGGGLAGCSLARQLASRGHRVVLLEKQTYPAHKLCGEFLSTEAQGLFERLGVGAEIQAAGPRPLRRTRLTGLQASTVTSALPGTALGLSRYRLDSLLFDAARAAGVDAHDGVTVRSITGSLAEGFTVEAGGASWQARMAVAAHGKRSRLDRSLDRAFFRDQAPYVAFKAHFEGLDLDDWIELHAFPGGYCGMSHIEDGRLNACWITTKEALRDAGGSPEAMWQGPLRANPHLAARVDALERVSGSFLAISQISLAHKGCFEGDVCMVGDTAAMIAPLCGDGMSMALRCAEIATPWLHQYLTGALSTASLKTHYRRAWEAEFQTRLRLGRWLHRGFVHPRLATLALYALRATPRLGQRLIRLTRGT